MNARSLLRLGWGASLLAVSAGGTALAQAPSVSQPVVQALPSGQSGTLNAALARLARDPRDISALIDAGKAALTMGDLEAATGFLRRAEQVAPGDPRVKAGLAGAMVRNGDPFGAIPLFQEAAAAGAIDALLLGDQGLAYDLVGDGVTAQRLYREALMRGGNDEVIRRLSLSLAIAGDKHGAELILSPLLQRRDQAAWRTRAFALAILGQTEEAVSIAGSVLPREIAEGIAPYLRYMPKLTHAQQAAAANFGAFPRASEIGRDDPRVAAYAKPAASVARVASADAALVPQGEPLGKNARSRDRAKERAARRKQTTARVAPPEPQPARQSEAPVALAVAEAAPVRPAAPPLAAPATLPRPPVTAAPPLAITPWPPVPPKPSAVVAGPATNPSPPAAPTPMAPPATVTPAAAAPPPPPPPSRVSLADAFREFVRPEPDSAPAAGAVDIRSIASSRPKLEPVVAKAKAPAAKPSPPSHPTRIWVQVATGRDKAALAFDWRRMARQSAEAFGGKDAFVSNWGQTNRLLTGPFATEAAANAYVAQLRRSNAAEAFVWTSPAGQVVDALAGSADSWPAKASERTRSSRQARDEAKPSSRRQTPVEAQAAAKKTGASDDKKSPKSAKADAKKGDPKKDAKKKR